jgi:hypothetical protein
MSTIRTAIAMPGHGDEHHERDHAKHRLAKRLRNPPDGSKKERARGDEERRAHPPQMTAQPRRAFEAAGADHPAIPFTGEQRDEREHHERVRHAGADGAAHRRQQRARTDGESRHHRDPIDPERLCGPRADRGERRDHQVSRHQPRGNVERGSRVSECHDGSADRHHEHGDDKHHPALAVQL